MGERIRQVRLSWGWNQTQLAEALGTNQQTVSHWEQGRQQPTDATLHCLVMLFGMSAEALASGKGFCVPAPPKSFGKLLVAANYAVDLIMLPSARKKEIWHVPRDGADANPLSPQEASKLIRQAHEDGRVVWVVV
jgi:transcriptional regulator with XRE-family HTH domain